LSFALSILIIFLTHPHNKTQLRIYMIQTLSVEEKTKKLGLTTRRTIILQITASITGIIVAN
jgi:hypothetical protein